MLYELKSHGDWMLVRRLGTGGFGEVMLWRNRQTKQEIATKRLKEDPNLSCDEREKIKDRWMKEVNWMLELKTPYIVQGIKLSDENDRSFLAYLNENHAWHPLPVIVMEYCNGGDVRDQLQRPENVNGLPEMQVRDVLFALRHAIEFLHNKCGVVHRDLKPDNIVITKTSNERCIYKLTDFGFARPAPEQTAIQSVVGTRHYFAPEIIDTARYKKNVDYWSLGIIAFELCCGELPFIPHRSIYDIMVNMRKKPYDCISIVENLKEPNQFLFKKELPPEQNLSQIFVNKITKWLPLPLDIDTKRRGYRSTANGIQDASTTPAIFTELDALIATKILTAYYLNEYKFLEFEVIETMTLKNLGEEISRVTGMKEDQIFIVLPTGHPAKEINNRTRPIDLYVSVWHNPVMIYIVNIQCDYNAKSPNGSETIRHCFAMEATKLEMWQMQQFILHVHFLLSNEQLHLSTSLNGLKEYALTVEDQLIKLKLQLEPLLINKWMLVGRIQQFKSTVDSGIKASARKISDEWTLKILKLEEEFEAINKSIDAINSRYESALRDSKAEAQNKLYDELITSDIFKLQFFRDKLLSQTHQRPEKEKQLEICKNAAIEYANERQKFLENKKVQNSRKTIVYTHSMYRCIRKCMLNADEQLTKFNAKLKTITSAFLEQLLTENHNLPAKLRKLDDSMLSLRIDGDATANGDNSLDSIMNISTSELKNDALAIAERMYMEIEQHIPSTIKRVNDS